MSYAQFRNGSRAEVILVSAAARGEGNQVEGNQVDFPEDYRSTYASYPGLVRILNPDQVIRQFANDIAM